VLIKGEPIAAPTGRADDFNWPRGGAATVTSEPIPQTPAASTAVTPASANPAPSAASHPAAGAMPRLDPNALPDDTKPKVAKKPAPAPAPARPSPFANIPNFFR
jgi:hypothetical protein